MPCCLSAAVAFSPDYILGLITQGVQALAGVLLPSLLCNDRTVLGPWVNTFRQNVFALLIVWSLAVLPLMLTGATFFPNLSTATLVSGLGIGVVLGVLGAVIVYGAGWYAGRRKAENTVPFGALDLEEAEELEQLPKLTCAERKAVRDKIRASWTTPAPEPSDPGLAGYVTAAPRGIVHAAHVPGPRGRVGCGQSRPCRHRMSRAAALA